MTNNKQAVFLDTSVLPRNADGNQDTRVLAELVQANIIEVFLSDIVISEWTSQRTIEFENKAYGVKKAERDLRRHPWSEDLGKTAELEKLLENLASNAKAIALRKCEAFFQNLQSQEIAIDASDAKAVFAQYFDGLLPFSEKKSRKDIPDAFILAALDRLSRQQSVFAGIQDGRLREAASKLQQVSVFENVKALVTSLKPLLDQKNHFEKLKAILQADADAMKSTLSDLVEDAIQGFEVEHSAIPDDNNLATVHGAEGFKNIEFDWDNVHDYENDWISIPFTFTATVELEFYVYRMDTFSVPDWVHVSMGDFEKDHYFEASGSLRLQFKGDLSVKFSDDEIEEEEWPDDFEIENLEVVNEF